MAGTGKSHARFLFARCALGGDRTWFLAEDGGTFRVVQQQGDKWVQRTVPWGAVALVGRADPEVETFVIGLNGEVMRGATNGFTSEQIDPVGKRPEKLGVLRDARFVGGLVHVVGMARQVYRRKGPDRWESISDSIIAKPAAMVGFNAVDGTATDNVLAVGLKGEIWAFDGKTWQQVDSPTNVSLNRVRFAGADRAYLCGQAGMLLEYGATGVAPAADPVKGQNFYGLEWFKKRLYVASQKVLFVLKDGALERVDTGLGTDFTTGYLEADADTLWSIGAHHIAKSADGKKWKLVICKL